MFPAQKSYLKGQSYQCKRILRGHAADEIPAMREELKKQCAENGWVFLERNGGGDFIIDGKIVAKPTKPRETWDVIDFMQSGFFKFNGEKVSFKFISAYDPEAGTFQTGEGFFTLYPLPA